MRVVAKFQLVASKGVEIDALIGMLKTWGDSKFELGADGTTKIKKSGVSALFELREENLDNNRFITFDVLEPVQGGQLQTQVKLLHTPEQVHFQCILLLGSESGLLSPSVDIRSPRFIRQIIELPAEWRVADDAERVFAKSFDVKTGEIGELQRLIKATQRRLPVVVISELRGETLARDIHDRISADTSGLASAANRLRSLARMVRAPLPATPSNKDDTESEALFVRVSEAARMMGIGRRIKVRKNGRKTLIAVSDIHRWFENLPEGVEK